MIGTRLRELRRAKGLTQSELAKRLKVADSTVSMYERNEREPDMETLEAIADEFNVDMNYLYGFANDKRRLFDFSNLYSVQIPLYSSISCGNGNFIEDNIIEYISLPSHILKPNKDYFAQYADGDSMVEAGITHGDLLVFEKTSNIENGQIGCFCIDHQEASCKKFYNDGQFITLQSANSKYQPRVIDIETTHLVVVGKLSKIIHDLDHD